MVRVVVGNRGERKIDFSFMPSLECDLMCAHCMYGSSPRNFQTLDLEKTLYFVDKFDWEMINSIGFYGGEPYINMALYDKFIALVPLGIPKFVITGGGWSNDVWKTALFEDWALFHEFQVHVSNSQFHKPYQNESVLRKVSETHGWTIKGEDFPLLPMGRAYKKDWNCSQLCLRYSEPTRLALRPGGDVIFQSCDGIYPVVQTYKDPFEGILDRVQEIILKQVTKSSMKGIKDGF